MSIILYDLCGRDPDVRFSPYCWRAKLALAVKGQPYRTVPTGFTEIPAIAGGAAKTVPVIDHDGTVVQDSFAIALHLDAAFADGGSLFSDEASVAAARFLESWTLAALHPVILRMIVRSIHDVLSDADQAYFRPSREARIGKPLEDFQSGVAENAEALRKALEPARRTLARHEWLGGEEPRFTDCILFGTLMWLYTIGGPLPLAADDGVGSWFRRCLQLHDSATAKMAAA